MISTIFSAIFCLQFALIAYGQMVLASPEITGVEGFDEGRRADLLKAMNDFEHLIGPSPEGAKISLIDQPTLPFFYRENKEIQMGVDATSEANVVLGELEYLYVFSHELTHLYTNQYINQKWPNYYTDFDKKSDEALKALDRALNRVGVEGIPIADAMADVREAKKVTEHLMKQASLLNGYDELLADLIPSIYFDKESVVAVALSFGASEQIDYLEYRKVSSENLDKNQWREVMRKNDQELGRDGVLDAYESFALARREIWKHYQSQKPKVSKRDYIQSLLSVVAEEIQANVVNFSDVNLEDVENINKSLLARLAKGKLRDFRCATKVGIE